MASLLHVASMFHQNLYMYKLILLIVSWHCVVIIDVCVFRSTIIILLSNLEAIDLIIIFLLMEVPHQIIHNQLARRILAVTDACIPPVTC